MTDRELLEYAAKAAGIELRWHPDRTAYSDTRCSKYWAVWNPLTDDGDALRLAVKLGINIDFGIFATQINCEIYDWAEDKVLVEWKEDGRKDPLAATRRAITRTAAEIGKKL